MGDDSDLESEDESEYDACSSLVGVVVIAVVVVVLGVVGVVLSRDGDVIAGLIGVIDSVESDDDDDGGCCCCEKRNG